MKTKRSSCAAFTLIELLIVIAIIGILMSTITVSLNAFRLKAQATQGLTDILRVTSYLETYKANYGNYPPSCGTGAGWASRDNNPWGCGQGPCWISPFSSEGWCPLPYNQNNPPPGNTAAVSQYIYNSNSADYKLLYHVPVSMGVPDEFIDPVRPTWAFGTWSPGAAGF